MSDLQTIARSDVVAFTASVSSCSELSQFTVSSSSSRIRTRRRARKSKVNAIWNVDHNGRATLHIDNVHKLSKPKMVQIEQIIQGTAHQTKAGKKTKKEEIENFVEKYKRFSFNNVPVSLMRHIIPLLLMEIYPQQYGQFSRKVKGMWERKPADWPVAVPFLDPNNKIKEPGDRGSKPTKEVLVPMLTHLVRKYQTEKENASCRLTSSRITDQLLSNGSVSLDEEGLFPWRELHPDELEESRYGATDYNPGNCDLTSFPLSGDLGSVEASLSGMTMSLLCNHESRGYGSHCQQCSETAEAVAGIPDRCCSSLDFSSSTQSSMVTQPQHDVSLSDRSSIVRYHGCTPHQVEDDDEHSDWNPVKNIIHRIKSKIKFLAKSKRVLESDLHFLRSAEDMLLSSGHEEVSLIEKAHVVELVIDVVKLNGCLSDKWREKLEDNHTTSVKEQLMEFGETGDIQLSSGIIPAVSSSMFPPCESDEDLVTQLNIEKRPAVGDSLLATTDILQVRSDISGSLENHVTEDNGSSKSAASVGAGCFTEHWQAGLQVVADEQIMSELSEKNAERIEVDLCGYFDDSQLRILDTGMVERELNVISSGCVVDNTDELDNCLLQPTPVEDMIDGVLSSSVPDTLNYQLSGVTSSSSHIMESSDDNNVASFPLTAAATVPFCVSRMLKSLPAENCGSSSLQNIGCGMPVTLNSSASYLPTSLSQQADVSLKMIAASTAQTPSSDHEQVVDAGLVQSTLQTLLVNATFMPSAVPSAPRVVNVCSPVGQITGTMDSLSIDNNHHPLLRGILTENGGMNQPKNPADQKSAEDLVASAAKRSAPIPVMVEEVHFDDGAFSGPTLKKVRSSDAWS